MVNTRRPRSRVVAAVGIAVLLVSAAMAAAAFAATGLKKGQTFYFIPKDTLNPYEVIADRGGKLSLTAIGDKQVVSSGTQDTAAAQQPSIQAAIEANDAFIAQLEQATPPKYPPSISL